ncbi:RDD family protein [Actinomyces sp. 565]|uniref:RDD family protein n=1 Tax=Actinomyces sp. 565 TaxID=2057794 RepID=UPI0013A69EA8|nr:RDD family protein [Actinomyces sp. 565]NDR53580.1 FHA domain-containing protein [Actinomyces sp. 565]
MTTTSASRRARSGSAAPAPPGTGATRSPYGRVGTATPAPTRAGAPAPVRARVLAGLIDLAAGAAMSGLIAALVRLVAGVGWVAALLLAVVIVLAVRELVLGRTGWSLGGRALGVQLVSERTGRPAGLALFLHADLTFICVVPTLGLGAIVLMRTAAADPQGRGWHDQLTGVRLIQQRTSRAPQPTAATPPDSRTARAGRRGPFSDGRLAFAPSGSPIMEVVDTVDSARAASSALNTRSAIIDSVPWSAVPMPLDSTTNDAPTAPGGAAADTAGAHNSHAAGPSQPVPAPDSSPDSSGSAPGTRRRSHTHHRKPEPETVGIRLVPMDGGSPILLTAPAVVGRDPQNISDYPQATRVSLADASRSVSKTHAAVAPVPGGLWVTDLHSTNGTRIDQQGTIKQTQPGVPAPAPVGSVLLLGRAAYRIEG